MRYVDVLFVLQTRRVVSVDALRGFSIFWIIGADGAIWTLDRMLRNKGPALNSVGSFLGAQMNHAEWVGFRFYDLIFPLFIFVTGVSIVLALPRLVEHEARSAHVHVLRRASCFTRWDWFFMVDSANPGAICALLACSNGSPSVTCSLQSCS
jgi:predicted acyltransferase